MIDLGPIIFVGLSQTKTGEIDAWYSVDSSVDTSMNAMTDESNFMNYTQVNKLYGKEYNLAPRVHFENFNVYGKENHKTLSMSSTVGNSSEDWLDNIKKDDEIVVLSVDTGVYFLDLQREAEINVGTSWQTDLADDECMISEDL